MTNSFTSKTGHGLEILLRGTVQGVGFRPFVYTLASRLGITGTVTNTGDGVLIKAFARQERLRLFLDKLTSEAPPLARITSLTHRDLQAPAPVEGFSILATAPGAAARTAIPPDIAVCDNCLAELADPADHRFRYPFINCTNCGPRFSIIETIPYDRPGTSMKVFPMCPVCSGQYQDPADRRFHAQPNACADCGPHVSWHDRQGNLIDTAEPLMAATTALAAGKIVAMRGLGGFHLVVDASSPRAINKLRHRKGRPDKPLAVMMPDMETVRRHCVVDNGEEALLLSIIRPIVLLTRAGTRGLPDNLAPHIAELGVMLPATPLQYLLFSSPGCPEVLVMTSGNVSGAPICTANEDALERLSPIADHFLLHNREIVTRVDDSVTRVVNGSTQILRRARGYVPTPLEICWSLPPVIGCGAGLKSTFCLTRETSAFCSQHIGDLVNLESYDFYVESIAHLKKLLQIEPELAVCDLHPDYLSSRYARELELPLVTVQHHHAHAVAVMAEHKLDGPALALVLDGTGYGPDGTIWGGEVLLAGLTDYERLAHFEQLRLPGGDRATAEPWRMGIAALFRAAGDTPWPEHELPPGLDRIDPAKLSVINTMMAKDVQAPLTSSCGRLFDGIASLLDIRQVISYEGQAAIELEALARSKACSTWYTAIPTFGELGCPDLLCQRGEKWEICSTEFVRLALAALARGDSRPRAALNFHLQLIAVLCELVVRLSRTTALRQVVLAGGCMQNSLLLEGLTRTLAANRLQVYHGKALPMNDGAISFGQTIIGGLQYVSRNTHASGQG